MSTNNANAQAAGRQDDQAPLKGTDVNMALAAGLGVIATAAFYLMLALPGLRGSYWYDLFWRSRVQHASVFFFFWGTVALGLKVLKLRVESQAFGLALLPTDAAQLIRQEDALAIIRRIRRLSPTDQSRLLTSRVLRALLRFKLLGSAEKVDDLLKYQADSDAESMESSFAMVRFFIALVPILGFLGTVFGISQAVSAFNAVIAQAAELDGIRTALKGVTIGLATAFDTTIVALVMSAALMLGHTIVQRAEENLLGHIEDHCLELMLDKLWVPPPEEAMEAAMRRAFASLPKDVAQAIDERLRPLVDRRRGEAPGQGPRP